MNLHPVLIPEFLEVGSHEKGFASHFKAKIAPLLEGMESNRLAQYASFKRRCVIAGVLSVGILIVGLYLEFISDILGSNDDPILHISFFLITTVFAWAYFPIRRYKEDVKSKFMPVICEYYGHMTYAITGESTIEQIYSGQIFPTFTNQKSEDFISGEYQTVYLKMHESTLLLKAGKSEQLVFKGLVIELEFPKKFKGKTLLRKDSGSFGNWMQGDHFKGLTRVALEDPEFESMFQIFSSDQVEARFVLTTAFMERILSLARLRSPKKPSVQVVFENNKMVLAVPSGRDLFEPGSIRKSILQIDDIHTFLSEMKEIFELVDVLKLKK